MLFKNHARAPLYTFPILSDPQAETIRRYNLLHKGGGPEGSDIARPAEFLVDTSGTVRWTNFTEEHPHPRQSRRDAGGSQGVEVTVVLSARF